MLALLETARANAALIAVLAPLAGAALAVLMPAGRTALFIAMLAMLIAAVAAGDLAWRALFLGARPLLVAESALALRLDGLGVALGALITSVGALVAIGAPAFLGVGRATPLGAALMLLAFAGWTGAAYVGDLVSLFIALEAAGLATIALASLGVARDRAALGASLRFLVAGAVAAALIVVGVGFVARASGTIDFAVLAAETRFAAPHAAALGFGLVLAGLALKAGLAPLHGWAGAFYGRAAPLAVVAFGAIGVAALLGAMARVTAYAVATPALGEGVTRMVLALGLASVAIGSVQAAGARNLLRLAAYAAAAQGGCVLIALAMGSPAGFAAALMQIGALAAAAIALAGGASAAPHPASLDALDGLARRAPFAAVAMTAGALSLMGAPLTIGFLGRWRLIEAGVGGGWWWAAGAVIVTSLAGVFYGGRLIERLYFRRASVPHEESHQPWRVFLAPALSAAIVATAYGVDPARLLAALDAAGRAAAGFGP